MEENEQLRLLNAIEQNTKVTERNLAATRAIAIFMLGWIVWIIAGSVLVLIGLFSLTLEGPRFGVLFVVAGAITVIVGAIRTLVKSLSELSNSSS